ncbi:MAG: hydrogenase expression/formation protein HypE [Actinobacteria bacterium]|nr:MAG: hydrogenase expression/formation protein HypE [Actinomycetota bacterium]RIK07178.1 MAG: hydrogenase expression/formation protein HypE [Acidobacteriota bacterium]
MGSCPTPLPPGEAVLLGHGSGGRLTSELIDGIFLDRFANPELARLGDSAVVEVGGLRLAFTTDAFVVTPAFFPGSDIGALSVNGTVNDLAMVGAAPLFLSAAFILEEGLLVEDLTTISDSMAEACRVAGVTLVTGDTKVVERGGADGIFITTSGVGLVPDGLDLGPDRLLAGDVILVSGPVGTHGVAVMSQRAGIGFDVDIVSDTAPLTGLVEEVLAAAEVHCLRDATRGGLATVLCELASASQVRLLLREADVPVLDAVRAACATLGLDPLYVANEGVCVAAVAGSDADAALRAARSHPLGARAAIVGLVESGPEGVQLETAVGTRRPIHMLAGEALPRIC